MYQIEKDTMIGDIVLYAPETMPLFQAIGMHCMGCALSSAENVEEACIAHGVDADMFVQKVNEYIAGKD